VALLSAFSSVVASSCRRRRTERGSSTKAATAATLRQGKLMPQNSANQATAEAPNVARTFVTSACFGPIRKETSG
jgi:hypothetical protein